MYIRGIFIEFVIAAISMMLTERRFKSCANCRILFLGKRSACAPLINPRMGSGRNRMVPTRPTAKGELVICKVSHVRTINSSQNETLRKWPTIQSFFQSGLSKDLNGPELPIFSDWLFKSCGCLAALFPPTEP